MIAEHMLHKGAITGGRGGGPPTF